jgi:sec-independent protein translocase protein TatA
MTALAMFGLGVPELLIILAVVLLLFGGSRLAGLGKSTGRALKEFKEETKGLAAKDEPGKDVDPSTPQVRNDRQVEANRDDRPIDAAGNEWPQQPPVQGIRQDPNTSDVRKDV